MIETVNKLIRTSRALVQELGREPSSEEIAKRMDIPVSKVRKVLKIAQEPISLETPIGEEEDSHLGDFIEDQGGGRLLAAPTRVQRHPADEPLPGASAGEARRGPRHLARAREEAPRLETPGLLRPRRCVYRSRMNPSLGRDFEAMDPLE